MYYILYDYQDNIYLYFDSIKEFSEFSSLRIKDINYKFGKSNSNFILCDIENVRYKLYRFNEVDYA